MFWFWFWIVIGFLALSGILMTFAVSSIVFKVVLTRDKPEKWGRDVSMPDDPEMVRLYADADAWRDAHAAAMREVSVENDGFRLCGQYYDLGFDRAVIIIPGRMEACGYSCHFAAPYERAGYNVLTIDNRSHGLSEGRYNSLGFKECRDLIAWARLLHDERGNRSVFLHGICIGSSAALFALTQPDCPDYLCGMAADGMYQTFYKTFKNHMIEQKRPLYPCIWEIMLIIRLVTGANVVTDGPIRRIDRLTKPILFLHSREDTYSLPPLASELYDKCRAPGKRLVWFDRGGHSRIRVTSPEPYDEAVVSFLKDTFG